MRGRDYKEFAQDEFYHVYNRGNGKQDIFKDEQDYFNFLKRIRKILSLAEPERSKSRYSKNERIRLKLFPENEFSIISYCLMPNHYHLLIRQNGSVPITKLISRVCTSYSMYFNRRHNKVGNLFQDIFRAVHVGKNNQLLWLSAYIHQNPKTARLVKQPKDWKWSSYGDYTGRTEGKVCDTSIILDAVGSVAKYKKFVADSFSAITHNKAKHSELFIDDFKE